MSGRLRRYIQPRIERQGYAPSQANGDRVSYRATRGDSIPGLIVGGISGIVRVLFGARGLGNGILAVDPAPEVDQSAPVSTEWKVWEVVDRLDLVGTGADRTSAVDHGSLFELELVEAGLAGSLLGVLVVSLLVELLSEAGLAGSLELFSAWAAFLYESLR